MGVGRQALNLKKKVGRAVSLEFGREIIVCINKVDKPASRVDWVRGRAFNGQSTGYISINSV